MVVDMHEGARFASSCVSCADLIGLASTERHQKCLFAGAVASCLQKGPDGFFTTNTSLPVCEHCQILQLGLLFVRHLQTSKKMQVFHMRLPIYGSLVLWFTVGAGNVDYLVRNKLSLV